MVKRILIRGVQFYQWILSPMMRFLFGTSGACRYSPSCSCYAIEALERHGTWNALRLTTARLLRCHPWGGVGHDPVPLASTPIRNRNPNLLDRRGLGAGFGSGGRKLQ